MSHPASNPTDRLTAPQAGKPSGKRMGKRDRKRPSRRVGKYRAKSAGREAHLVRVLAAKAFLAFEAGRPLVDTPPPTLADNAARRLYRQLLMGLVRHRRLLAHEVNRLEHRTRQPDPPVTALAMMGIFQLRWLDGIPPHAAVHETVEAAGALGCARARGWINGVLRTAQREIEASGPLCGGSGPANAAPFAVLPLAVRTSHPDWMVARWMRRYGAARCEAICKAHNRFSGTTVRVETARINIEEVLAELEEEGIEARVHPTVGGAITVSQMATLLRSALFRSGRLYIQDAAAQLLISWCAASLAEAGARGPLLDVCAAPGGKLTHLRRLLPEAVQILGADVLGKRLQQVRKNLAWLRTPTVPLLRSDGAQLPFRPGSLGGIVLDVPCMSTGVIRKYPDIKWRKRATDLPAYIATQRALLEAAARALAPGGRLLYITCSLEPEENEAQVADFLARQPAFQRLRFKNPPPGLLTPGVTPPITAEGDFQTLPDDRWMGLYGALLERSTPRRLRNR